MSTSVDQSRRIAKKISVTLTPENHEFVIRRGLGRGYTKASQIVNECVRLVREVRAKREGGG